MAVNLIEKRSIKVSKRGLCKPVHDVMVGMPIFNIQSLFRVSVDSAFSNKFDQCENV